MSAAITSPVVKPKVHRLPASMARKPVKKPLVPGFLFFWGGVFVALLAISALVNRHSSDTSQETAVKVHPLPQISVTPQDVTTEQPTLLGAASSVLSPPISDAQAATVMTGTIEKPGKIILLKGQSESIVGQMAKIPLENEQITEIKAVTDIDNDAGRELLSIISKY